MTAETSALSNLLTQEELDALLNTEHKNLSQLIQTTSAQNQYPKLKENVESLSRFFVTTLQKQTQAQNVAIALQKLTVMSLGSYLDTITPSCAIGIYSMEQVRQSCLIAMDSTLCYTLIDMRLGGRRGTSALQVANRTFTQIEKNILSAFLNAVTQNMQDAFGESFAFENLNTTPQTALIASPACEVTVAQLQVNLDNRKGCIDIVIPAHIVLDTEQTSTTEQEARDETLAKALLNVPVTLKAVLDKKQIPFSKILKWKKGDILDLTYFDDEPLDIMCGNTTICKGALKVDKKLFFITVDKKEAE